MTRRRDLGGLAHRGCNDYRLWLFLDLRRVVQGNCGYLLGCQVLQEASKNIFEIGAVLPDDDPQTRLRLV